MMRIARFIALSLISLAAAAAGAEALAPSSAARMVTVQSGRLAGTTSDGVSLFRGIPFAAPPVGRLRWRAPEPAPVWRDVRKASSWGPACPQPIAPGTELPENQQTNEDCLYLNVWTPAKSGTARLPVMVWIHGGSYISGSGSFPEFNGAAFARDGVVLVTFNYRLGMLGFFAHPGLTAQASATTPLGDYGLMDQIAALQWVKRNIAAFGGDPDKVTVFGESAGGGSLLYLLTSPAAQGLFRQAIIQSAPAFSPEKTLSMAEQDGSQLAFSLGAPRNATAEQLRGLPVEKLVSAATSTGFTPFVDGRLVPMTPERAILRGQSMRVPLMIGSNSDEGELIEEGLGEMPAVIRSLMTPAELVRAQQVHGVASTDDPRFARESLGDLVFGAPARWIAAQQSRRAPTFLYRYDYVWSALRGRVPGAAHGADLLMVFATVDQHHGQVSGQDRAEAQIIHHCWTSFAKTGKPACPGGPEWPAYEADSDRLMEFGSDRMSIASDYRKQQFDFWQPIGLRLSTGQRQPEAGQGSDPKR